MLTEKQKMLQGELYNPLDEELVAERLKTRLLLKQFNDLKYDELQLKEAILKELIPNTGSGLWIEPPFYCDYGSNITVGNKVFFNFNSVVLYQTAIKMYWSSSERSKGI